MRSQPLVVGRAGDAEHGRAGTFGQLHGYRAHPAGGAGDGDGVTRRQFDQRTAAYAVVPATNRPPAASHVLPAAWA